MMQCNRILLLAEKARCLEDSKIKKKNPVIRDSYNVYKSLSKLIF